MDIEGAMTASLADILELRADDALSESEIWSLLSEAAQTLQDLFVSGRGNCREKAPALSPTTLEITSLGRILIRTVNSRQLDASITVYLAPEYKVSGETDWNAFEWEKMWIYSLGQVLIQSSVKHEAVEKSSLEAVLQFMIEKESDRRCSLNTLLEIILEHHETDVSKAMKPFSHDLMELYREVYGSLPSNQCLPAKVTDRWTTDETMTIFKERSSSKKTFSKLNFVRGREARMYREAGGPKGPEFVVRGEEPATVFRVGDLDGPDGLPGTSLSLVLLTGEKVEVVCDPETLTCGQVLRLLVRTGRLQDDFIFGLARLLDGDFLFLPHQMKVYKTAPSGWKKEAKADETLFLLYVRVKFFFPDLRGIKSRSTKHLIYLQLRRSLLEQEIKCKFEDLLNLGGLALQAEFGDFDDFCHGTRAYFLLEHYFPEDLLEADGLDPETVEARLRDLHKCRSGLDRNRAEEAFIRGAQSLPGYGSHHCSAIRVRKAERVPVRLTVTLRGISIIDIKNVEAEPEGGDRDPLLWENIDRISCDRNHFRIECRSIGANKINRYKFHMSGNKSSLFFRLASSQHRFSLMLRNSKPLQILSQEFGVVDDRPFNSNSIIRKSKNVRGCLREFERHPTTEPENENLQNKGNEVPKSKLDFIKRIRSFESDVACILDCTVEPFSHDLNESVSPSLARNLALGAREGERILRKISLSRDERGFYGLEVVEGDDGGIYVADVARGGSGLRRGDELVAVDGTCLLDLNYKDSLAALKKAGTRAEVVVLRNSKGDQTNSFNSGTEPASFVI